MERGRLRRPRPVPLLVSSSPRATQASPPLIPSTPAPTGFTHASHRLECLHHQQTNRTQTHYDNAITREQWSASNGPHAAGQRFNKRAFLRAEGCWKGQSCMLYMFGWHANVFSEAAWIDIGGFEGGTHGIVAMLAVMTCAAGNVMSNNYTLPHRKIGNLPPFLNNRAGKFVSQLHRR